jgi:integrase
MNELQKAVEEYLNIRRKLGFKLIKEGSLLPNFAAFLEQEGASFITIDLALRWATQVKDAQPYWWAARLQKVRVFAQYYKSIDPRTEIPPKGLLPHRYHRKPPYIYSDKEIIRLIGAANQLSSNTGLRPYTYSALFGLIAVTGMRMIEPISLDCEDVDLKHGILTVRKTKFNKTRLVPIHPSTRSVLQKYASIRDQIFPRPKTPSFFVSDSGIRLNGCTVRETFAKLSCQIGLRKPGKRHGHGPRLQDLRHKFSVKTILTWYRAGLNVEREMPKLATFLGHTHVNDTYWYLSAVPELMQLAVMRLEKKGEGH